MATGKLHIRIQRILISVLAIAVTVAFFPTSENVAFGETVGAYNVNAAIEYAKVHYDDGYTATTPDKGDCVQFVRECFEAGGVPKDSNRVNDEGPYGYTVDDYRDYLVDNGYAGVYELAMEKQEWSNPQWYVRAADNEYLLSVGDGILYYCESCKCFFHMAIATGVNDEGFILYHAQNVAVGGEPLCSIDCSHCGGDKENVSLYSVHLTTQENGYVSDYDEKAVSGLTVKRTGADTLDIEWEPVEGAAGYKVFISNGPQNVLNLLADTPDTAIEHVEEKAGANYYFAVRPYFANDGKVYVGKRSERVFNNEYLIKPTGVKAALSGEYVTVTWDKVPGADEYRLYRSTSKDSGYKEIFSCTGTGYKTSGLASGTTFYFKVQAINKDNPDGNSLISDAVSVTTKRLSAPTGVRAVLEDKTKVKVTWNKVDKANQYDIYMATSADGSYKKINETVITGTGFRTSKDIKAGNTYYFKVQAINKYNSKGNSLMSAAASIKIPGAVKLPVTASNNASTGKPKLSWNKVSGAGKYIVYRAGSANGTYKQLGTTTGTSYTNTSAGAGYTYYYKVKAVNSKGTVLAESGSIKRLCRLAKPSVTKSTSSAGKPKLSWKAVSGATKYEVYRATTSGGKYTRMITTTGTNYTNTSAKTGYTYYYKVRAISGRNSGANVYSSEVKQLCTVAKPSVTKGNSRAGKPKLSWKAVSGAKKYEVYRATTRNGKYTRMITTTNRSYINTSAKKGYTYYYKVKAIESKTSNYAYSSIVSVKCK